MAACTAADDTGGFKFGADGISGLRGDASRSVFGGRRLRWVDTVRIGGGGGKYDTSRVGAGGVPGRPGFGRGDRPVPPGCAGVSVWRPAFVACASSAGSGDCSICGPGNNAGRSRTPGHRRSPGKTVDAVALHGFPAPRFRRAGTTATEPGKGDLIYRGWSAGFFGPAQKARWAANGRGFPIPPSAPPRQSLGKPRR